MPAIPRRSSPSRCHVRPHLRSTFGFRLRPVGDASPYLQPVLGAAATVLEREPPFNSAATGPGKPVSRLPCAERAPGRLLSSRQPEPPASLRRASVLVKRCRYLRHGSSRNVRQASSGHNDCTGGRSLTRSLRVGPRRVPAIALAATRTTAGGGPRASVHRSPTGCAQIVDHTARNRSTCLSQIRSRGLLELRPGTGLALVKTPARFGRLADHERNVPRAKRREPRVCGKCAE